MSKLSNLLNMYLLLQGRNMMKVKELADIIEVSERTIKGYKEDLEKAGIYIGTKSGRYGGYFLENKMILSGLTINKEEYESLILASKVIQSGNHIFSLDFEKAVNKIISHRSEFDNIEFFTKENLVPAQMKEKEKVIWNTIKKAIINKKKLKIIYSPIREDNEDKKYQTRTLHPYGTFNHDGSPYLYAYCELRKGIRYFKFSRMIDIKVTGEAFKVNKAYDIKKEMRQSFGIMDDDLFDLKLIIRYPMSQLVKEKQYTDNQKITELDEDTIQYEARLKGYKEVKTWILSMGSCAEVVGPKQLKEDIINEINKTRELYIGTE